MVRALAAVLGGPNTGWPRSLPTSCRSTVSVRRKKSTRSTVRPNASPWRSPVPAHSTISARNWGGTAAVSPSTASTGSGSICGWCTLGSLVPSHGLAGMILSRTAARNTLDTMRKATCALLGASGRPRTHAWISLDRIELSGRSPKTG
jgi:hypothetical protein